MKLKLLNTYVSSLEHTINLANTYRTAYCSYFDSAEDSSDYLHEIPIPPYLRLPRFNSLHVQLHISISAAKTWVDIVYHGSKHDHLTECFIYRSTFQYAYEQLQTQYEFLKELIESKIRDTVTCQTLCAMKYDVMN